MILFYCFEKNVHFWLKETKVSGGKVLSQIIFFFSPTNRKLNVIRSSQLGLVCSVSEQAQLSVECRVLTRPWPGKQETWLFSKESWSQVIRKEAGISEFPWLPVIHIKGLQVALWDFSQLTDDITVACSSSNVHTCFAILIIIIYYWWSLPVVQNDGT